VDKNREEEQLELKRNVAEASAMAEIAQGNLIEAHEENIRLKALLKALKDGDTETATRLSISTTNSGTPTKRDLAENKAKIFFQNLSARFKPSIQNFNSPLVIDKLNSSINGDNALSNKKTSNAVNQKDVQKSTKPDESSTGSLTDETASIGAEA